MARKYADIMVFSETKERLGKHINKCDTWDAFLNKLIDDYEHKVGYENG